MSETFTIEVELPDGDTYKYVDIEVTCDYSIHNNGIGPYEYWGFRGYDRGVDYAAIEDAAWDKSQFTAEEIKLIQAAIDKELVNWEQEIMDRVADRKSDYRFYSDGD